MHCAMLLHALCLRVAGLFETSRSARLAQSARLTHSLTLQGLLTHSSAGVTQDVLAMPYGEGEYDFVIDKGTLDTLAVQSLRPCDI